jgi:glucokinase
LAVAGPVIKDECVLTNLSMKIDGRSFLQRDNIRRVKLLNDLEASAYGLMAVPDNGMICIHKGKRREGNQVLISPGTGLGESIVHAIDGRLIPLASEGGHADFAPFNGATERLWSFLRRTGSRVSVEDVLSGTGIHNIFRFLLAEEGIEIDENLKKQLKSNPGLVITERALKEKDQLSYRSIQLFIDILAAEAGNMALKAMSVGGIYLGGGIVPRLLPIIDRPKFVSIMSEKGKHKSILEEISIYIVTDTLLPIYGAAWYGYSSNLF